jgi:hypothetical protein
MRAKEAKFWGRIHALKSHKPLRINERFLEVCAKAEAFSAIDRETSSLPVMVNGAACD